MHIFEHEVLFSVNHLRLLYGFLAPQHEDYAARLLIDRLDYLIAELLPSLLLVRV